MSKDLTQEWNKSITEEEIMKKQKPNPLKK